MSKWTVEETQKLNDFILEWKYTHEDTAVDWVACAVAVGTRNQR